MTQFVQSSALTRLLANIFIFLVLVTAVFIAAWKVLNNQQIDPLCYTAIAGGMSYAINMLGVHAGVHVAEKQIPPVLVGQSLPDATHEDTQPIPKQFLKNGGGI